MTDVVTWRAAARAKEQGKHAKRNWAEAQKFGEERDFFERKGKKKKRALNAKQSKQSKRFYFRRGGAGEIVKLVRLVRLVRLGICSSIVPCNYRHLQNSGVIASPLHFTSIH